MTRTGENMINERKRLVQTILRPAWLAILALVASLALVACGGDDNESPSGEQAGGGSGGVSAQLAKGTASENKPGEGKKGGKLTMLSAGDVDYIDPGQTYYSYTIGIMDAIQRRLYAYEPDKVQATPDIAASQPEISEDGKTVTVKLRKGIMFSEPVNREVVAKDFKYAIERGFSENVQNGYVGAYMANLVGAPEPGAGPTKDIPGIETPDDYTLVFKLTEGTGGVFAGALTMPITVPVPQEYAKKYDAQSPSTYGTHQVFTGPYMIERQGNNPELSGYRANRFIRLDRNPQYVSEGDFRPAFLDEIDIQAGNEDSNVAARRVLEGDALVTGDGGVPPTILRDALQNRKDQISLKPSGGFRFVSMDTQKAPFDDINVRKAVVAGFDRNALRLARGGEAIGPIAQHYIPPGIAGFEESGGEKGFGEDFMANPKGDKNLMAEYFKKAGFQSGKFEGDVTVLIVADSAEPDRSIAESTERQLRDMGFKTQLRLVSRDTMYTRYCNRPKSDVQVCPSVGWLKDFPDPQTMLDATFNGKNILPVNNSNWPELDVPEINAAMVKGKLISNPDEKAKAWADINKMIVDQAPGVPYVWDYENVVGSKNVRLVQNLYSTLVDLNFTSLR